MNEADIYRVLDEIFKEVFLGDDVVLTPQLTARDVHGWDSFKQIEIIIACEDRFGIRFRTPELDKLASVGDLVALIASKCH